MVGWRHVRYPSQLSGRNNPRKEAEFSRSGGCWCEGCTSFNTHPFLPELCLYYSGLNLFGAVLVFKHCQFVPPQKWMKFQKFSFDTPAINVIEYWEVKIAKEMKRSDSLWCFACGNVFFIQMSFLKLCEFILRYRSKQSKAKYLICWLFRNSALT